MSDIEPTEPEMVEADPGHLNRGHSILTLRGCDKKPALAAALRYAEQGYAVIPLKPNTKVPLVTGGYKAGTTDSVQIKRWWLECPEANIGLVTGPVNGIFVLDVDVKNGQKGAESLQALCDEHGALPDTWTCRTPSGGLHYYFATGEGDVRCSAGKLGEGLDVRAAGGYIVAPPSKVYNGEYEWISLDAPLAPLPPWLMLLTKVTKKPARSRRSARGVSEGGRNDHIFRLASRLRGQGVSREEAEVLILTEANACDPPLEEEEALGVLESAYERYPDGLESPPEVDELNERHFLTQVGGKAVVVQQGHNPVFDRPELNFISPASFRLLHNNRKVLVGENLVPLGNLWLAAPGRREYKGIIFEPEKQFEGYFNLWQGFAVQPVKGDCELFLEHIRENIAGGDDELYCYLLAWAADAVQNPGSRPGVAVVLRGKQGTGKGIFATEIGGLFGQHFVHLRHGRHLTGNFNSHLEGALIVFADEAFWAGDKQGEGALKGLVTEEMLPIERKGHDVTFVKNYVHLIVASNEEWVVPAGLEERRFCVIDVGNEHQQDTKYFGAIVDQMGNGGREALLDYLLNYDLSTVDLREIPKTDALLETKKLSMPLVQSFWFEVLENGALDPDGEYWGDGEIEVDRLYSSYIAYAEKAGRRFRETKSEFGFQLRKLVPGELGRVRRAKGLGRSYFYQFPPLDECREHFAALMKTDIDWPQEFEGWGEE